MRTSDPLKDLEAQVARNDRIIGETVDKKRRELNAEIARLELSRLRTEIEVLKNDIQTVTVLAQGQGDESKVEDLHRQLATKVKEYEACEAKYQLEFSKPKRWWQFWK